MISRLPDQFLEQLNLYYGLEAPSVVEAILTTQAPVSIRYNRQKTSTLPPLKPVKWHPGAVYLDIKPVFTLDPSFHAGRYYVQEASSMFLYEVIRQINPAAHCKVLDLCASPGGKSTLLADYFVDGVVVANEVIKGRTSALKENCIKWGTGNIVVTQNEASQFSELKEYFDIILVDAPCSGEGMFRKDPDSIGEWSLKNVDLCAARQKSIVHDIVPCLKPGGYLIYSTCTFNSKENIENVDYFQKSLDLESIHLDTNSYPEIKVFELGSCSGYQFLPDRVAGEGFFISVLQKPGQTHHEKSFVKKSNLDKLSKNEKDALTHFVDYNHHYLLKTKTNDVYAFNEVVAGAIDHLLNSARVLYSGVKCGKVDKNVFIPDHALALSKLVPEHMPRVNLTKSEALQYLQKTLNAVSSNQKSWQLACYDQCQLGWLKNLGNRINNYYPMEWRIRMNINQEE